MRVDKLKEEIGWLKVVFAILMATVISLLAWLVQNYEKKSISHDSWCARITPAYTHNRLD